MNVLADHSKIISSFFLSLGVIFPWLVGLSFDYGLLGSIASFGAYLIIVSFPKIPSTNARFLIILISICSFTLFAFVGASIKIGSIYYYSFALLFALAQAVTEIKQGYLRLPIALSTLAYFLSIEQVPVHSTPMTYGLLFFLGTLIGGVAVLLFIPKIPNSHNSVIQFRNDQIIGYFILVTIFVLLSSYLATFFDSSHACWLTAAGLRVIKPTYKETFYRIKTRGTGTFLGALLATFILLLTPSSLNHLIFVGIMLFLMLIIGAKRYGLWTFCLTSIALSFDFISTQFAVELAIERVGLTLIGIGLILLFTLIKRTIILEKGIPQQ